MAYRVTVLLFSLLFAAAANQAQTLDHPSTMTLDGGPTLPLAAQAQRRHLLGSVPLYNVAVYSDGPLRDLTSLSSWATSKAARIVVTFEPDLKRRMTLDWRGELIPPLEPDPSAILRSKFAPLQHDDVVLIEYTPAKGTTVTVNKGVAVSRASHDLMLAYLDHWLGQRPISEALKAALLRS